MELRQILLSLHTEVVCLNRLPCDRRWADYGEYEHIDPFGRIYYLRSGRGHVFHHGQAFEMQPGFLYSIPAHCHARYWCKRQMDLCYLHYTAEVLGSLEVFRCLGWTFAVLVETTAMNRFWDAFLAQRGEAPEQVLRQEGMLRELLAHFAPTHDTAGKSLQELQRFSPVFRYMEEHLCEPIRLAELAELVHLQPTYFSNLFSAFAGIPPMRYLLKRRVERAAGWLWQGEHTIGEIAQDLGFSDIYHFSKTFRQFMGLSPTAYRKQAIVEHDSDTGGE